MKNILMIILLISVCFSCIEKDSNVLNIKQIRFTFDQNNEGINKNIFSIEIQKNEYVKILSIIKKAKKINKSNIRKNDYFNQTSIKAKIIINYFDSNVNNEYVYIDGDLVYDVNRKIYLRSKKLAAIFIEKTLIIFSRLSDK